MKGGCLVFEICDGQTDRQTIDILGVTITTHLSVSEHVSDVIGKCGQTMYVLKVLRSHGLNDEALKDIYRSVVMAKLLYASSAWWGFATASKAPSTPATMSPKPATLSPKPATLCF